VKIRRLTPADAPDYRALMLSGYGAHPDAFTATVEERAHLPLAWWEKRLAADPAAEIVVGAFAGGELVGSVGLRLNERPKTRHQAVLFAMYVRREHTGRGAGAALLRGVLDEAEARSWLTVVHLTVTEGNQRASSLYERAGFAVFGVQPYAVLDEDGYRGKVHMWRPLSRLPQGAGRDAGERV